jgi:uncharacterized protein
MNKQVLKKHLKQVIAHYPEIALAYLFGSQVDGNLGPMSDVDVALYFGLVENEDQILAEITHELNTIKNNSVFDIVSLNRAPVELAYAIIAGGECIYQVDTGTRVEFEATILSRYGDYLPVLRMQREEILRGDQDVQRVQRYREALRRTERTLSKIRGVAT